MSVGKIVLERLPTLNVMTQIQLESIRMMLKLLSPSESGASRHISATLIEKWRGSQMHWDDVVCAKIFQQSCKKLMKILQASQMDCPGPKEEFSCKFVPWTPISRTGMSRAKEGLRKHDWNERGGAGDGCVYYFRGRSAADR